MAAHAENEPLLMHFFQDSLTGAPLEWYMQLERANVRTWGELADAFLKQYHYNTAMAPIPGTIQGVVGPNNSNGNGKKPYSGFVKKKEGETSTASIDQGRAPVYSAVLPPYYPMPYVVPSPYVPTAYAAALPQPWVAPQQPFVPQQQLLPQLLANQLVQLRELGPPPDTLPPGYDVNAHCEFHSGAPGHTIEKCRALKLKVQDLIDDKIISFTPTGPNVQNNPMPPHAGATNAIEWCDEHILVTGVDGIKMPLAIVRERLVQQGVLHELHNFCLQCSSNPEECASLREEIQKLMDEGILRVERVVSDEDVATLEIPYYQADVSKAQGTPLIIHAPSTPLVIQAPRTPLVIQAPNTPLTIHSQAPSTSSPASSSLADSKDVPWSYNVVGRIFAAPPPPPKETNKDVNAQTKGKQVVIDPPEPRTAQDAEQLLRIIKKSDYKVIDQLDQTQAKISILSLLVHSEAHRDALRKILASAHVTQDITVPQFEEVVTNIAAGNCLGFCDDELPPEGRAHNKALHISIRRSVEREIDFPVKIGPHTFYIAFYVMDIRPSYTCLLGRPWIHAAGAVTSTLHQCLKFVVSDKVVVITGEEDMVINNLTTYRYVEVEREVHETPFQALEIVSVDRFPVVENKKEPGAPLSSLNDAKAFLEAGVPHGAWGKLIDVYEKQDKYGLGYQPSSSTQFNPTHGKKVIPPISQVFVSASTSSESQAY
ncbi:uncharacterized protein LOC131638004 [Vicia villosa]|uniref:uncharacterized protein LOC131638004 n=1 Tax=Vicia villosa TaxID=3911 RepID=UPI00273C6852|nr:uncharacterized protein LOC131638004 [Vicia villosa]